VLLIGEDGAKLGIKPLPQALAIAREAELDRKHLYSLLHKSVTYHFTYFTSRSQLRSAVGGFDSSARSIRWLTS